MPGINTEKLKVKTKVCIDAVKNWEVTLLNKILARIVGASMAQEK